MPQALLVVDDDVVLGEVLSRVLTRDGHSVILANDGVQAVQAARQHQPRLALVDLCLPDGDGVKLAEKLRLEHPDLLLILMTAFPLRVQDNPEIQRLFACVLTKPLNVKELRETIERTSTTVSCS
jgi:DNA-binding response OmpR family regulator